MSPIIGARYHKIGEDYDLCEAEFAKISSTDKSLYEKIDLPRHNPCHGFPRMFGFGGGRGFGKFGGHFQGHPHAMGGQHPFAGGRGCGKKGGWWRQHGAGGPLSARFVADVNLPDGTNVEPGNKFIKTWRLCGSATAAVLLASASAVKGCGTCSLAPGTASLVQGTAAGEHRHAHNAAATRGARGPERAPPRRRCQLEECGPKNGSTDDETAGEETATRSPSGPSRTSGEREEGAAESCADPRP